MFCVHIRIGLSFGDGRMRPSPSARVQSLCAYTDMHRGHRWGCHRQFKMDGLCEKAERLYTQTPENGRTPNWGIGHLVTAYTRKHKQGQADTSWRHVRRCHQTSLSPSTVVLSEKKRLWRFFDCLFNCQSESLIAISDLNSLLHVPPSGCHTLTTDRLTART